MNRAAIVATIVTSILAFSPPSLAASDEELGKLGDKMRGAFRCSTYASMFYDQKEEHGCFKSACCDLESLARCDRDRCAISGMEMPCRCAGQMRHGDTDRWNPIFRRREIDRWSGA